MYRLQSLFRQISIKMNWLDLTQALIYLYLENELTLQLVEDFHLSLT